jgi:hypothetical protein
VSISPDWAELQSVSGRFLIALFRWTQQWDEYGENPVGVVFGASQDLAARFDPMIAFVTIPNKPGPLPSDVFEDIAYDSAYGITELARLVRAFRTSGAEGADWD